MLLICLGTVFTYAFVSGISSSECLSCAVTLQFAVWNLVLLRDNWCSSHPGNFPRLTLALVWILDVGLGVCVQTPARAVDAAGLSFQGDKRGLKSQPVGVHCK